LWEKLFHSPRQSKSCLELWINHKYSM
jgi:hypothetical protein